MAFKITHQAAYIRATEDARAAKKSCDYNGISFCQEDLQEYRYRSLGDVTYQRLVDAGAGRIEGAPR